MEVAKIDGPLLHHLRTLGVKDEMTAAHSLRILSGDTRSQRAIAQHCSGDATFEDDVIVAPLRIAHGIHWCGGQLRMVDAHAQIPSGIQEALIGRPLVNLIEIPGVNQDVKITRIRHDDTQRFDLSWRDGNDPTITIVETDAEPAEIQTDKMSYLKAPWERFIEDERLIAEQDGNSFKKRKLIRTLSLNLILNFVMMTALVHSLMQERDPMESIAAGIICGLAWSMFMLLASNARRDKRDEMGGAHLRFSREMREKQIAEGMRD